MDAAALLTCLWGESPPGLIEIARITFEGEGKSGPVVARHFSDAPGAVAQAALWNEAGHDVYTCVSVGEQPPKGKRLSSLKEPVTVTHACGFVADIDYGRSSKRGYPYPPGEDEAIAVAGSLLQPTVIIDTLGGLHAWWLFDEPYPLVGDNLKKWQCSSRQWTVVLDQRAQDMGGWRVDHVQDAARLMRLPGFKSWKHGGDDVHVHGTLGPRYKPYEIVQAAGTPIPRSPSEKSTSSPSSDLPTPAGGATAGHQRTEPGLSSAPPAPDDAVQALTAELQPLCDSGEISGISYDVFEEIRESEKGFKRLWNLQREDFGTDLSLYDASIAWAATQCGLSLIDTAKLVSSFRKKHDDGREKWRRADYLARTVLLSRRDHAAGLNMKQAARECATRANERVIERGEQIPQLQKLLDLPGLKRVTKFGHTNAQYSLVFNAGMDVLLGGVSTILSQKTFGGKVMDYRRTVPRKLKAPQWAHVERLLITAAKETGLPECEPKNAFEEMLWAYLAEFPPPLEKGWMDAARNQQPFWREDPDAPKSGVLHVHAVDMAGYSNQHSWGFSRPQIQAHLRFMGWDRRNVTPTGTSRSYYRTQMKRSQAKAFGKEQETGDEGQPFAVAK